MVKLDKIYTRGGDKGKTSLGDGSRVPKNSIRVIAYGSLDSANSAIGLASCYTSDDITITLRQIQNDLFDAGADLCIPIQNEDLFKEKRIKQSQTKWLEDKIDFYNDMLTNLTSFILPGGSIAAAHLHMARTATRSAEINIISLAEKEVVNPNLTAYINRLSDLIFVLARVSNLPQNQDVLWKPGLYQ